MGSEDNNGTPQTAIENGGGKKRNFAAKLATLRTYREIPKEELASGDLVKQTIKPKGVPSSPTKTPTEGSPSSPEKQPSSNEVRPLSPTIIVKPEEDNNSNGVSTNPTATVKLLQQVSAARKNSAQTSKPKSVSFSDRPSVVEIPSIKYLEQLQTQIDNLQKENESLVKQQAEILKKNQEGSSDYPIKEENKSRDVVLDNTPVKQEDTNSDALKTQMEDISRQRDEISKLNHSLELQKQQLQHEKENLITAQDTVLKEWAVKIDQDKNRIRELEQLLENTGSDSQMKAELIQHQATVERYKQLFKESESKNLTPLSKMQRLVFLQFALWVIVAILLFTIFTERMDVDFRAT